MCITIGHFLLTVYISLLIWIFWDSWAIGCIRELNTWLGVYLILEVLHLTERTIATALWKCANDPKLAETRLFVFVRVWLYLIEANWIIYGSTFIYDDKFEDCSVMEQGDDDLASDHVQDLKITIKVLIIYGYLLIIYLLCGCCIFLVMYKKF